MLKYYILRKSYDKSVRYLLAIEVMNCVKIDMRDNNFLQDFIHLYPKNENATIFRLESKVSTTKWLNRKVFVEMVKLVNLRTSLFSTINVDPNMKRNKQCSV